MAEQKCPSCQATIDGDKVLKRSPKVARLDDLTEKVAEQAEMIKGLKDELAELRKGGKKDGEEEEAGEW